MTEPISVLIVAKYPVVSAGLRWLLESEEGLQVAGESTTVAEAVALARCQPVEIALIDADSDQIGLCAVAAVAEVCRARILVFTAQSDPGLYARAIELGASGIVSKDQPLAMLVRAIRKVHDGELWLDRANTASVLSRAMRRGRDPEAAKIESLTKREREIIGEVGKGLRNSAIAERLFISEATVRNHLTSILSKLALADRFQLAVYAFRHALVASPEGTPGHARLYHLDEEPRRAEAADRAPAVARVVPPRNTDTA